MVKSLYRNTSALLWQVKFFFLSKELFYYKKNKNKIKFIFGVGRSGTTWISKVLSNSETPIRSIQEPLTPLKIKYNFKNSPTSLPYSANNICLSVLYKAYNIFSHPTYPLTKIYKSNNIFKNKVYKNKENFNAVIIKEVHSLLVVEKVIKYFNVPTILIIRDVAKTIDSQLFYSGLDKQGYLNEFEYLTDQKLLNKYFTKNSTKIIFEINRISKIRNKIRAIIQKKALVIHLINEMFKQIAEKNENVIINTYEQICVSPLKYFKKFSKHFDIKFGKNAEKYLINTQSVKNEKYHPNSVFRNTKNQINKRNKFITNDEQKMIEKIIFKLKQKC